MSYYENPQWPTPSQNNWEHQQGTTTPARAGVSGPQPQDDFAFSYQFDEVDRAFENLQKSGKGYAMGARRKPTPKASLRSGAPIFPDGRVSHSGGPRSHPMNNFDGPQGAQGPQGHNLHNFYASQRHQPSRGSNEAEQVMQAKRRMAAQRERELRNLHTEQQYQRNVLTDGPQQHSNAGPPVNSSTSNNNNNNNNNAKHMSEEETRELIARQRSALYGEGPFADKTSYVDESGNIRPGVPGQSGPSSIRGPSPLAFDTMGRTPSGEVATPGSVSDHNAATADPSPRPQSTSSPQSSGPTNKAFDNAIGPQSRTSTSSPTGGSPPRDFAPGSKPGQTGPAVAPIGTRPSGTPSTSASGKRSTTPLASSGGWGRGNGVWGQSSGLGAQASVWG
ncbi:hypothetical protein VFPPC_16818 [Pochonia chlamydosporia 170]|uniref:Uncharacterized protein n=1 Tax=Pochonia chlamydosporia 170 TaxID=1380566 RepID=A0A179F3G8_METCM|nr:hypothetical protein VFPPC_16818 [Pochonia chlamydosporia 170]OAQ59968.1 hypothetical protein VFPPC_16818 [Pochonia chlamydosporia 170]